MTRATETQMTKLRSQLQEVMDLRAAVALLRWAQAAYMPPDGGAARCRQLALLQRLAQEINIFPTIF